MKQLPWTLGVPRTPERKSLVLCAGHFYRDRYEADPTDAIAGLKWVILLAKQHPQPQLETTEEMAHGWCLDLMPAAAAEHFDRAWLQCCQLLATGFAEDIPGWGKAETANGRQLP
ncbi:MAG TPA: hypothetical protein VLF21_01330 [Candidatus Saccharimonadales bacterium]|nr:hypothetical protein [Candidatus Saccharimonadales bacterium]